MTDEQIVKALECCGNMNECKKECPLGDVGGIDKCIHTLMLDALELIKRQQSEIEDLMEIIFTDRTEAIKKLKAEAVREFAEFLIDKAENNVIRIGDLCDYVIDFNEMTKKEGGKG